MSSIRLWFPLIIVCLRILWTVQSFTFDQFCRFDLILSPLQHNYLKKYILNSPNINIYTTRVRIRMNEQFW